MTIPTTYLVPDADLFQAVTDPLPERWLLPKSHNFDVLLGGDIRINRCERGQDYNSALCKKSFPRPTTRMPRYGARSSTSCTCLRSPINSALGTASGRLTQCGAT